MDFSEGFKYNNACKFSPNGKYIAHTVGYRLIVKNVETLQMVKILTCIDEISHIDWSGDSKYILCAMYSRGSVEVWNISDDKWRVRIDQGPAGVTYARFSPDSKYVLVFSNFQLRITIWNIIQSTPIAHIKNPKFSTKAIDFAKYENGSCYMALAERRDCKDYISIITTNTWELVKHIPLNTKNLTDLKWSPDSKLLCVWDSLLDYKVNVYTPAGQLVTSYSAYENALGIKTVRWSPAGNMLAIGSYDSKVRILNKLTWDVLTELEHISPITKPGTIVFREVEHGAIGRQDPAQIMTPQNQVKYIINELPVNLKTIKISLERANPKVGVGLLEWSADGKYLLTRNDNMPNALWVWDISRLRLAAMLIQLDGIKCAQWDPVHTRLALCTGNRRIYMWSPEGASCVDVPVGSFNVHSLKWNSNGESIVLCDYDSFCVAYPSWNG